MEPEEVEVDESLTAEVIDALVAGLAIIAGVPIKVVNFIAGDREDDVEDTDGR